MERLEIFWNARHVINYFLELITQDLIFVPNVESGKLIEVN